MEAVGTGSEWSELFLSNSERWENYVELSVDDDVNDLEGVDDDSFFHHGLF